MSNNYKDLFISYNSADYLLVEQIANALKERGLTIFLDRWELVPGKSWPEALEQHLGNCGAAAIVLGPNGMGQWQQREQLLALNRQANDPTFGVIPVLLPGASAALGFLSLNTWVDFSGGFDDTQAIDLLAAATKGQLPNAKLEKNQPVQAQICPYRGLEVFREEDAPFFFGREEFTQQLCDAVEKQNVVAVVGRSGSGKSSVVRAGLVPRLRRSDTGKVWEIVTLVPGDRPLRSLSSVLLPLLEPEMSETKRLIEINDTAEYLADGKLKLRDIIDQVIKKQPGTDRLLLIVDQWEELYTHASGRENDHKRLITKFIDELLDSVDNAPLTLVLTLRADFYGEVLQHRKLTDCFRNAVVNLGPMEREELTKAIKSPAEKVNLEFDTGLVDNLLDDVGKEPGNLPLLEFALKQLWEQRQGSRLLYERYKDMGRVKGAIAQRAEALYADLNTSQKHAIEYVFTRLVRPGNETGDTRRRAEMNEFEDTDQQALIRLLAGPKARLLITGTVGDVDVVEVSHEALIREWDRVKPWIDKVRNDRRDQTLMEDLAQQWDELDEKVKSKKLATGQQLRDFARVGAISALAGRYLDASLRQRRRRNWGIAGSIAFLAIILGFPLTQFLSWSDKLGLDPRKGVEVLMFRAGLSHPEWIPAMVEISAEDKSFQMGSPNSDELANSNEKPQHMIAFTDNFKIGRTEVTFKQYCAGHTLSCPSNEQWDGDDRPVVNVTWDMALEYADWLSRVTGRRYRLPTEAEWEYAARAGSKTVYWWGDSIDQKGMVWANCNGCGSEWDNKQTAPVGRFEANGFGLSDMHGNVWEWTADCWHEDYTGAPVNGEAWLDNGGGDCKQHVMRGGAWNSVQSDLRSAYRRGNGTFALGYFIGFRLAQN